MTIQPIPGFYTALRVYIRALDNSDNSVHNYTHRVLRAVCSLYGKEETYRALDRYWALRAAK